MSTARVHKARARPCPPEGKPAAVNVPKDGAHNMPPQPEQTPGAAPDGALSEMRFLTVAEVATLMRVSRMTVYRLVHSGELPAVRVGRSFRVPERAVHDYLQTAFNDVG